MSLRIPSVLCSPLRHLLLRDIKINKNIYLGQKKKALLLVYSQCDFNLKLPAQHRNVWMIWISQSATKRPSVVNVSQALLGGGCLIMNGNNSICKLFHYFHLIGVLFSSLDHLARAMHQCVNTKWKTKPNRRYQREVFGFFQTTELRADGAGASQCEQSDTQMTDSSLICPTQPGEGGRFSTPAHWMHWYLSSLTYSSAFSGYKHV